MSQHDKFILPQFCKGSPEKNLKDLEMLVVLKVPTEEKNQMEEYLLHVCDRIDHI